MKCAPSDIRDIIVQLAQKINAPNDLLPTYGYPIDSGRTDIEIDDNGQIYYFPDERDRERLFLRDLDDLLYYVFNSVTQAMATKYELSRRISGQDPRRIWFAEQERLLGILDKKWELRKIDEHKQVLKNHPFRN